MTQYPLLACEQLLAGWFAGANGDDQVSQVPRMTGTPTATNPCSWGG